MGVLLIWRPLAKVTRRCAGAQENRTSESIRPGISGSSKSDGDAISSSPTRFSSRLDNRGAPVGIRAVFAPLDNEVSPIGWANTFPESETKQCQWRSSESIASKTRINTFGRHGQNFWHIGHPSLIFRPQTDHGGGKKASVARDDALVSHQLTKTWPKKCDQIRFSISMVS